VEEEVYRLAEELRPPKWIAKRLKLCPSDVIEMLRVRDRRERKEARSARRVEKMISDARRSTLPVKMINFVSREYGPKDPPKGGGKGTAFLPSGLVDKDFTQTGISLAGVVA
jgi:hypothetical protein